jgi:hypothetical protein
MADAMTRAESTGVTVSEMLKDVFTTYLDVQGDGGYKVNCPLGHTSAFVVNVPHHELLFDSACISLLRGAFREAVGGFAVARERFGELFLRAQASAIGVSPEVVDKAWAHLEGNSQRQIGAYVWTSLLGTSAVTESAAEAQKQEQFRNRVVHKGTFPSRDEAYAYAEYVYAWIRRGDARLREEFAAGRENVLSRAWHSAAKRVWDDGYQGSIGGAAYFTVLGDQSASFEEALEVLRRFNPWTHPGDRLTVKDIADGFGVSVEEVINRLVRGFAGMNTPDAPESEQSG